MNTRYFIFILLLMPCCLFAQKTDSNDTSIAKFETFEHKSGDTTYIMKKYFLCLLKKGDNRSHDEATAAAIQKGHMEHIQKMADSGKLAIAGPMGDEGEIRGIFIFNVPTLQEAERLANQDPAVKAGRLKVEIHPWWAAQGTKLP